MEKQDELEELEAAQRLQLHEQYKTARELYRYEVSLSSQDVYLANDVHVKVQEAGHSAYFETTMLDCWVWDANRQVRTLPKVLAHTFGSVIIEDWGRR
jgi:hypothetical protein